MASLRQIKRTGQWQIRFYWNGEQRQRSCLTKRSKEANRVLATVEDTLHLLKTGRLEIPADVDAVHWIMTGGKLQPPSKPKPRQSKLNFGEICDAYFEDQSQKEETTLGGESIHINHLKRILSCSMSLHAVDLDVLKKYRKRRLRQKYHGKLITDGTIRKELVTFRQIWVWAQQNRYVEGTCPLLGEDGRWKMTFEKPDTREKFQTWGQITRRIKRGGLTSEETKELWKGLFLDNDQIIELLKHVETTARHPFIYPMFCFTAYTGARRSEIVRSEVEDFDFERGQILIRERKRRKDRRGSTRFVPLHPKLAMIMQDWFQIHPGGRYTVSPPLHMPYRKKNAKRKDQLTFGQADYHFDRALKTTKWTVISGFHVLRHSFGSNLIRTGTVSSDIVGKWMGHTTEEMRELYQHLFPQDGQQQIVALE